MAENRAAWGIEIGQAGLKAIRLKYAEQAKQALAVAFDFIPHAKILSQPDAIPKDLIRQAMETFLSRNQVAGDLVAISAPGHSALARFIQLPPVETSKVSDVVKYEAKQQIPFDLNDVIWDFQTLGGGIEESGFMLGAEVGLFAMKKEQVHESLRPFNEARVEVELVQLAPLALYNFLSYDQMGIRRDEEFSPPDEHIIMLDMGTDNTTLLVTNGEKIWIRNVPLGGTHFTRALTKEMKLTYAKAEHLKCNATKSPDPRAVFQALRPIFNDYVNEIQRSIGYFSSVNRSAKISRVVGVGNGFKLAGLQKFLQQNLQYEVERVETFNAVIGDSVLNAPVFQENIMSFAVPYGLALQALGVTRIHTTLLPREIAIARKIRRKKPWAVTTAASVLAGLAISAAGYANVYSSVSKDRFDAAEKAVESLKSAVATGSGAYDGAKSQNAELLKTGEALVNFTDRRELTVELYRAVNECLPRPIGLEQDEEDIRKIKRITIRSYTMKRYADLKTWFDELKESDRNQSFSEDEKSKPPTGPGYAVTLVGEHFYEPADPTRRWHMFVQDTLIANLKKPFVKQDESLPEPVPVAILGISHPLLTDRPVSEEVLWYPKGPPKGPGAGRPGFSGVTPMPMPVTPGQPGDQKPAVDSSNDPIKIQRTRFTLQFAWKPTLASERVLPAAPEVPADGQAPLTDGTPPPAADSTAPAASPVSQ